MEALEEVVRLGQGNILLKHSTSQKSSNKFLKRVPKILVRNTETKYFSLLIKFGTPELDRPYSYRQGMLYSVSMFYDCQSRYKERYCEGKGSGTGAGTGNVKKQILYL